MFKLSKENLAILSEYKNNVTNDKNHVKKEIYQIVRDMPHSQKVELFKLCGHPDMDMRRFSSIHMKGELGLKSLMTIAQITNHNPAYISGDNYNETLEFTRESVCDFLRKHNAGSLCSIIDD